jgi:hypothetical protein
MLIVNLQHKRRLFPYSEVKENLLQTSILHRFSQSWWWILDVKYPLTSKNSPPILPQRKRKFSTITDTSAEFSGAHRCGDLQVVLTNMALRGNADPYRSRHLYPGHSPYLHAGHRRFAGGATEAPKAITATTHKLARLVYAMLKQGTALSMPVRNITKNAIARGSFKI